MNRSLPGLTDKLTSNAKLGDHPSEKTWRVGDLIIKASKRAARFSSPLGVYDFQKRSSIIFCSPEGASELGKTASVLARGESLTAHARSAEYRIKN